MSRGLNRSERLKEMERLYVQHGYTDIEMADRLSVTRPTAYKDRIELEREIPFTNLPRGLSSPLLAYSTVLPFSLVLDL
jgi:hypothetical protein